ncbi:MAG: type II toxin-antitoxin system VapC family toxin [Magnetococcales bacterium]|nr:type II toxin-antitoxin system VapC family toxin [Magnetococcales bacterium]
MTPVLVDSNILLDIITDDPHWLEWSESKLVESANRSRIIINPVIYSEVSVGFNRIEDLESALPKTWIEREAIPYEAAFLAGKAFRSYRGRDGQKRSPLPDFLIGAHAAVAGYRLLTRDAKRYRTHFPKMALIAPD